MKNPGQPGASPIKGRQSAVPLTMAGHERTARSPATAGTAWAAAAMLAASAAGSTRKPPAVWRDGQPPPMTQVPFAICLSVSLPAAE
ncbi:hypothetical protein BH23PSE1_BH23PSE1_11180 [soil metagenome]